MTHQQINSQAQIQFPTIIIPIIGAWVLSMLILRSIIEKDEIKWYVKALMYIFAPVVLFYIFVRIAINVIAAILAR